VVVLLAAAAAAACGGAVDPGAQGNAGAAGSTPSNDDVGLAGTSGHGGTSGAGGSAGSAGTGGALGDGGQLIHDDDAGLDVEDAGPTGSWLPLATGNTWTYQATSAGVVENKVQTIGEWGPVGGSGPNAAKMAFAVVTEKADGADMTESWQAEVDGKIIRYRERSFVGSAGPLQLEEHWEPFKLRLDGTSAHVMPEVTWIDQYSETKLPVGLPPSTAPTSDTWRVVAIDEQVQVPAGTFNALVVEKTGGTSTKRYWFVRGIGKVKETGTQVEELVSYQVQQ